MRRKHIAAAKEDFEHACKDPAVNQSNLKQKLERLKTLRERAEALEKKLESERNKLQKSKELKSIVDALHEGQTEIRVDLNVLRADLTQINAVIEKSKEAKADEEIFDTKRRTGLFDLGISLVTLGLNKNFGNPNLQFPLFVLALLKEGYTFRTEINTFLQHNFFQPAEQKPQQVQTLKQAPKV